MINMMWIIKFMQKRPSDANIRISRIIFGLILIFSLYYNLIIQGDVIDSNFFWLEINEIHANYIKYVMISLWIIPVFMWISNVCLLKKKHMRIFQLFFAIILFYISWKIVDWPDLDIDSLILFMWLFPLFAWITWKCITSNCLKYKEKINKIRI